jgi:hypothetical protein
MENMANNRKDKHESQSMSAKSSVRKSEADRIPKICIEDLHRKKMFTVQEGGWVSWHDPYIGNEVRFCISNVMMDDFGNATEGCIEISKLRTDRMNEKGEWHSEEQKFETSVAIATSPGTFGGLRYWFKCTGVKCRRRISVLYLKAGYLACLNCHNLTYQSRNLSGHRKKLGKVIPMGELNRMQHAIKRYSYNNIPTKRVQRFLKKHHRSVAAFKDKLKILDEHIDKVSKDFPDPSTRASKG